MGQPCGHGQPLHAGRPALHAHIVPASAFGISDFDEKRYLLTLLAGKSVMVAMMALFGQSLLSSLKNPVYLILAIAIWAGMYWVSRKFCKKHDLDR